MPVKNKSRSEYVSARSEYVSIINRLTTDTKVNAVKDCPPDQLIEQHVYAIEQGRGYFRLCFDPVRTHGRIDTRYGDIAMDKWIDVPSSIKDEQSLNKYYRYKFNNSDQTCVIRARTEFEIREFVCVYGDASM